MIIKKEIVVTFDFAIEIKPTGLTGVPLSRCRFSAPVP
jgi:hypothetical protein